MGKIKEGIYTAEIAEREPASNFVCFNCGSDRVSAKWEKNEDLFYLCADCFKKVYKNQNDETFHLMDEGDEDEDEEEDEEEEAETPEEVGNEDKGKEKVNSFWLWAIMALGLVIVAKLIGIW